jgi:hypothetical protein
LTVGLRDVNEACATVFDLGVEVVELILKRGCTAIERFDLGVEQTLENLGAFAIEQRTGGVEIGLSFLEDAVITTDLLLLQRLDLLLGDGDATTEVEHERVAIGVFAHVVGKLRELAVALEVLNL